MSGWTENHIDPKTGMARPREVIYYTMELGWTPAEIAEQERRAKVAAKPRRGSMNKLETRFESEVLKPRLERGEIVWYDFESWKCRLADGAWYCPDFTALERDTKGGETTLRTRFYECKGFWREAARVRIKVAADKYPFRFVAVTRDRKTGEWQYEEFTGRASR